MLPDAMGLIKITSCTAVFAIGIYYLKQYMNGGICSSQARIDGKVVIITGANTGIGKETAKDLIQRGAKVYLACRTLERAQQAAQDIQKETGASADKLPIILLDLNSLKSVREFVKEFRKNYNRGKTEGMCSVTTDFALVGDVMTAGVTKVADTRLSWVDGDTLRHYFRICRWHVGGEDTLDILINNAGVMLVPQGKTEDGFETTLGVNHLGHFLLTNLLMDALASAPKSRIVNLSSHANEFGTMNFDDLMSEKNYSSWAAYCQSKLANVLFTRELAKRLKETGITTYAVHPGAVRTDLWREVPFFDTAIGYNIYYYLTWPLAKEPWNGAQTTICCAVDENLASESGKYYSDCKEYELSKEAQDDESARKLWDISVNLVELDSSEIHPKLK